MSANFSQKKELFSVQLAEDVYIFDLLCTVYFIYCKHWYLKLVSSN